MIEHIHPEGEPTPTLRDLYERKDGSVEVVDWATPKGKPPYPSKYRLTDKGYAVLGEIMRRNGAATAARGTAQEEAIAIQKRMAEGEGKGKGSGSKSAWTPS